VVGPGTAGGAGEVVLYDSYIILKKGMLLVQAQSVKSRRPYITFEHREVSGTGALAVDRETVRHILTQGSGWYR
jgi:hypothetical protein